MNVALPLVLAAVACAALGILSRLWLPFPAGGQAGIHAHQHLAATLGTMAWYVMLAVYAVLATRRPRPAQGFGRVMVACWMFAMALLATILFAATYTGLAYRWFWSGQVVLVVLLGYVRITADGLVPPAVAAREADAMVVSLRKVRIANGLRELAARALGSGAADAAPFARATEQLADALRSLPASASGYDITLLLSDVTQWLSQAQQAVTATSNPASWQQLAREAVALRLRLAQWWSDSQ